MANDGNSFHPSQEHHFCSLYLFLEETEEGQNGRSILQHFERIIENCDFENREEVKIRDIFITNMLDDDIHREPLQDTIGPQRTLSIPTNVEMGLQTSNEYLPTTTLIAMQSMLYNHSVDFAAQMLVQIK